MLTSGLFMSLDGRVDADDQWQYRYFDEEFGEVVREGSERVGAVLVGRTSFEGYDRLRQEHPESPALELLNRVPKYVVSTTLERPQWEHTHVVNADVPARIRTLVDTVQRGPNPDVLLLGSPSLVRFTLEHALLDRLKLLILPIIVGTGPRLFADLQDPIGLAVESASTLRSGIIHVVYTRPATVEHTDADHSHAP